MRPLIIPISVYACLILIYLRYCGAPLRVDVLAISVLGLGYLVPASLASFIPRIELRACVSAFFVVAAMLTWDGLEHLVIVKSEPFSILSHAPWAYVLGLGVLVSMCLATSWASLRLWGHPAKTHHISIETELDELCSRFVDRIGVDRLESIRDLIYSREIALGIEYLCDDLDDLNCDISQQEYDAVLAMCERVYGDIERAHLLLNHIK